MIVCSIDLCGGLECDDVLDLARRFGRLGEIAVIDRDAELGRGDNRELLERLCRIAPCRVGGIRDVSTAKYWLRRGARRVIVGSLASESLLRELPRDRTIVAIDARGNPVERARRLRDYCGGFLLTGIDRDGPFGGIDVRRIAALQDEIEAPLTVADGVTTSAEIRELDSMGIDAEIGRAICAGALDPVDAFIDIFDFAGCGGLLSTIVCDARDGSARMLAYSTRESLSAALRSGTGTYWSRSRETLWRKGETSGCTQRLVRAQPDCDRDAVLFFVEQQGATCHTGAPRCFGEMPFSWNDLIGRIDARLGTEFGTSYTRRLAADASLLNEKIVEEAAEVVDAPSRDELAWECADLLYFLSVKMRAGGLRIEDVMHQLAARATDP